MSERPVPGRAPRPRPAPAAVPPVRGRGAARGGRLRRAGRFAVRTASVAVLLVSGVSWSAYHLLAGGLVTSDALDAVRRNAPVRLDNSVNLLLIGLDSRKDMDGNDLPKDFVQDELHAGSSDIGGYNTNTLILMHIPANGGRVTAFSIPRDDYVEVPGVGGMHKIKEAYGLAKAASVVRLAGQGLADRAELEHRSREAGRQATLATVQQFLGVPIDHFAEVNLLGFYDIAKVLEPIEVCLKHPVHDRYSGADFPAGPQRVDARQALAFVRQRHGLADGDLDRTHRQQAFLASVIHKLKEQGIFGDLGRMRALFGVVKRDLVIDRTWNVLDFAQQTPSLTGGNVEFRTLPVAGFAMRRGESVNLVDPARIRALVQSVIGRDQDDRATADDKPPAPARPTSAPAATVDVLNASGAHGAAAAESRALAAQGYRIGRIANAPARGGSTTVIYGQGAQAAAEQIAARLAPGTLALPGPAVPAGHVVVTLGGAARPLAGAPPAAATAPRTPPPPAPAMPFRGPSIGSGGVPCVD